MEATTTTATVITGDSYALRIPIMLIRGPICDGVLITDDGAFLGRLIGETVQPIVDAQGKMVEVRDPYWFTYASRL